MLVSIITASYNYEKYIVQTIESVLNQTYKNWEMIIVDDGSKDSSIAVIRRYCEQDERIKLFTHENGVNKGLVETIKLGLLNAKGEWVAFLESDDMIVSNYLERKIEVINQHPVVKFIFNDVVLLGGESGVANLNKNIGWDYLKSMYDIVHNINWPANVSDVFIKCNFVPTFSSVMLKKNILKKINYNSPVPQWLDTFLWSQLVDIHQFYFINEKLTCWRLHQESQNNCKVKSELQDFFYRSIEHNILKSQPLLLICKKIKKLRRKIIRLRLRDRELTLFNKKIFFGKRLPQGDLISIIIPVYNSEKYIARALNSVLKQSYRNIEVIIIYLDSTDNTLNVINTFKDKRIKLVHQEQKTGVGGARNIGVDSSTGKYLGFVEADDYIPVDYYEKLYRKLLTHESDVAMSQIVEKLPNGSQNYLTENAVEKSLSSLSEKLSIMSNGAVFNKLFKSSIIKGNQIKFVEHYRFEDNPWLLQVLYYSNKVVRIKSCDYFYCREDMWTDNYIDFLKRSIPPVAQMMIDFAHDKKFSANELTLVRKIVVQSIARAFLDDKSVLESLKSILGEDFCNNNDAKKAYTEFV